MQNKNIALAAPFTSYSGYGQYARSIAMMLVQAYRDQEGVSIFLYDLTASPLSELERFNLLDSKYSGLIDYMKPAETMEQQFFDVFMTCSVPQAFLQKGLINIGITALAEVDKVHPVLVQYCNRMDEVIVMSEFNVDTLKRSMFKLQDGKEISINVPISVVPSAFIDIDSATDTSAIVQYIDKIPQKFLFLCVGQWLPGNVGSDRKDIGSLIATFLTGFKNNKQIGLLLKVDQGRATMLSQYAMRQRITEIAKGVGAQIDINNIYFISGNLLESQMKAVYTHNKVKALVSFTHGQSLGIPIMQFIGITGKPVVVPYHSGMLEYIRPEYSEVLIHKQTQVPQQLFQSFYRDFMIPESRWYTIDYQYALYKMAEVISNYDSITLRTQKQQQHVLSICNLDATTAKLKKVLDKHIIQGENL